MTETSAERLSREISAREDFADPGLDWDEMRRRVAGAASALSLTYTFSTARFAPPRSDPWGMTLAETETDPGWLSVWTFDDGTRYEVGYIPAGDLGRFWRGRAVLGAGVLAPGEVPRKTWPEPLPSIHVTQDAYAEREAAGQTLREEVAATLAAAALPVYRKERKQGAPHQVALRSAVGDALAVYHGVLDSLEKGEDVALYGARPGGSGE